VRHLAHHQQLRRRDHGASPDHAERDLRRHLQRQRSTAIPTATTSQHQDTNQGTGCTAAMSSDDRFSSCADPREQRELAHHLNNFSCGTCTTTVGSDPDLHRRLTPIAGLKGAALLAGGEHVERTVLDWPGDDLIR
jgi:hypothetical protein